MFVTIRCPKCTRKIEVEPSTREVFCECGEAIKIAMTKKLAKLKRREKQLEANRQYALNRPKAQTDWVRLSNFVAIMLAVCFVIYVAFAVKNSGGGGSSASGGSSGSEDHQQHEKADVVRQTYGINGSDKDLAGVADSVKELNREDAARAAERQRYLGQ